MASVQPQPVLPWSMRQTDAAATLAAPLEASSHKVLATEPRRPDASRVCASRTSQEPWTVIETCLDACRRWEALLDSALPKHPCNPWGQCPPLAGEHAGMANYSGSGSPTYAGVSGLAQCTPMTMLQPFCKVPVPHGSTSMLDMRSVPPMGPLGMAPTLMQHDSGGGGLALSGRHTHDQVPWKLALQDTGSLAAAQIADDNRLDAAVSTSGNSWQQPPGSSPTTAGAAAGAVLLQLLKERPDAAAAFAAKNGAEAGAVLLQQLKTGQASSFDGNAIPPKGDAEAGAALLRQVRQPQNGKKWWHALSDNHGACGSVITRESDGIIEAHMHTDGNPYVWVDGEWIRALGRFYCWHCGVFGNKIEDHLSSEEHKVNCRAASRNDSVDNWKNWAEDRHGRKRRSWH